MKAVKNSFRHVIVARDIDKIEQVERAKQARAVVTVFVLSALFMSTGLGMVGPVFAHVFKEASSGVRSLSVMMMVPQIALLVLSPLVGGLEDRYGRRPFLLLGFAGLVVTNTSYLFAHSAAAYTGIRLVQAIAGVGIVPATLGILADAVPEQQRTRRISLILAGHAGGLALGPIIGGFLLQCLGTTAPFGVSALLNFIAFCLVCLLLPKISPTRVHHQQALGRQPRTHKSVERVILSLMVPLALLAGLLGLDFVSAFARTFVEPQQALYLYKVLKLTPVQFGLLMSSRGVTMLLGQLLLSRWGDSINRRVIVALGLLGHAFFLFSLLSTHQFTLLFLVSLFAGIGGGMVHPLLSACYLEKSAPQHHSSIIGIKEAIGAFGEIAGSLVVVLTSSWLMPQSTFLLGGCIIVGTSLLAFFIVKSSPVSCASPVPPQETCQDDRPTLPLSRVRLADLPTLPLSRVRLADQPTLVSESVPLPDQPQPLKPALSGGDEGAWLIQRSQAGLLHAKFSPHETIAGASHLSSFTAISPMMPGAGEREKRGRSL